MREIQNISRQHLSDPRFLKARKKLEEAVYCQHMGLLAEADKKYSKLLKENPDYFDALHFYGLFKYQQGQYQDALKLIARATKINPRSANALNSKGVILGALGRHSDALGSFDSAIVLEPKHVPALSNRGNSLNALRRYQDAINSSERALTINPNYFEAYIPRAAALREFQRYTEALESYERAIALNLNFAIAWVGRGNVLCDLKRYDEAFAAYDKALALKSDLAEAWLGRGNAFFSLNRDREALECFNKAIALEHDSAEGYWNKSLLTLSLGQYEEGWQLYEWRWKCRDFTSPVRNFSQPLWLGKADLTNKTILIHSEQGLGDTIQFFRYLSAFKNINCNVLFEVPKPLVSLFREQSLQISLIIKGDAIPRFDFQCPLMSLPLAFNTTLSMIPSTNPYLSANEDKIVIWQKRLGEKTKPRIGLVWSGNLDKQNRRNIPLEILLPFITDQYEWFALQTDIRDYDRECLNNNPIIRILPEEFSETAAIINNLDLVISVDTSLAHLTGALGKPVWILLPFHPDFRWLRDREDSPWYPTARLFRQTKDGEWSDVLERISSELSKLNINGVEPSRIPSFGMV